jgi:enoyl reductase-like protein
VFDQDPQRVCILQGPVAAKWSVVKDEPVKDLLGNINKTLIKRLLERKYGGDASTISLSLTRLLLVFLPASSAPRALVLSHTTSARLSLRLLPGWRHWEVTS